MNLRFKPTSVQTVNNPATDKTAFLWFHSIECDVGIVIEPDGINKIISCLNEVKEKITTRKEFFGSIKVIE